MSTFAKAVMFSFCTIIFFSLAYPNSSNAACKTVCVEHQNVKKSKIVGYETKCIYTDLDGDGVAEETCFDVPIFEPYWEKVCVRTETVCPEEGDDEEVSAD